MAAQAGLTLFVDGSADCLERSGVSRVGPEMAASISGIWRSWWKLGPGVQCFNNPYVVQHQTMYLYIYIYTQHFLIVSISWVSGSNRLTKWFFTKGQPQWTTHANRPTFSETKMHLRENYIPYDSTPKSPRICVFPSSRACQSPNKE